ncbi:translational GTPase TypA [Pseudokordiimonas caeni]|uniref:translational GTPase TypA n=1 Tax=Pseudokordiimonas caeni TaxID=2997908 RepID=UPI002811BD83|nr:translational GTPase TypA [Pseudokordiimonas caeni]
MSKPIRNIAIIAHVDHGKTTLVDNLFRQSGTVRDNQRVAERAMDSGDLERERGITILAKCTSVVWNDTRINIVDTPGHADFGGEVERILSMVDGVVLLVDAAEGPMPQTKFVTMKALALGLKPIVVVNKVDKPDGDPDAATDACFDLFVALGANDEQLDFPILYASGRDGWAVNDLANDKRENLNPLFAKIVEHVEPPKPTTDGSVDKPFSMLVTLLDRDNFVGRVLTGRVQTGRINIGDPIRALNGNGEVVETGRITKLLSFRGLERVPVEQAEAGDIIAIAGLQIATVADTIAVPEVTVPLRAHPVDPPTLAMTFAVNDSPLAGREGKHVTSRVIRDRLMREAEGNVAIKITEAENNDAFEVAGRGELQLGVLIETMRREGFELAISRPRVLFKMDEDCKRLEPYETVQIDVDEAYQGVVVEKMSLRKAELKGMAPSGGGKVRLTFDAPARGLIGYHGEFLTDTRGTGIMNRIYDRYDAYKGPIAGRQRGVLIANGSGKAVAYALWNLEERGVIMIETGDETYEGMIIGEHSRDNDLDVNVQRAKQLTNIRAAGKDEAVRLTTPRKLPLEEALAYINDDELVEVTPKSIRLRKRFLKPHERKKAKDA